MSNSTDLAGLNLDKRLKLDDLRIYDITQELFGCKVYPGDPAPAYQQLLSIEDGAVCNLTSFEMCTHNGTHLDAPKHFIRDGAAIDEIPLERFTGRAVVYEHHGELTGADAEAIVPAKKLLFKGDTIVSLEAAHVFAKRGVELVGVESQTVGPFDAPAAVHNVLLGEGVVLLEGVVLGEVPAGEYFLCAMPLRLGGFDGAPCRAVLFEI